MLKIVLNPLVVALLPVGIMAVSHLSSLCSNKNEYSPILSAEHLFSFCQIAEPFGFIHLFCKEIILSVFQKILFE